jgi:hypothetical protein
MRQSLRQYRSAVAVVRSRMTLLTTTDRALSRRFRLTLFALVPHAGAGCRYGCGIAQRQLDGHLV